MTLSMNVRTYKTIIQLHIGLEIAIFLVYECKTNQSLIYSIMRILAIYRYSFSISLYIYIYILIIKSAFYQSY